MVEFSFYFFAKYFALSIILLFFWKVLLAKNMASKINFSFQDFFAKRSHLLNNFLRENFIYIRWELLQNVWDISKSYQFISRLLRKISIKIKRQVQFFLPLGMLYKCYDNLFAISQIFFSLLRHVSKNITKFNKNIWYSPKTLWKPLWYISNSSVDGFHTHLTFTFSKSTLQTLEKGVFKVQMFEVNNKNNTMTSMTSFWCFYC